MRSVTTAVVIIIIGAALGVAGAEPDGASLRWQSEDVTIEAPVSSSVTGESVTGFAVDSDGTEVANGAVVAPRVRLGLSAVTQRGSVVLSGAYEHDLITGYANGDDAVDGAGMPATGGVDQQLRKANVQLAYERRIAVAAGVMTSHWGLGLIANDGDHGWAPGSARFADPRGGDRVVRGVAHIGVSDALGAVVTLAGDSVWGDDVLLDGDSATQLVAAVSAGVGKRSGGGVYAVRRSQTSADGAELDVIAVDLTARTAFDAAPGRAVELAVEAALITGTTTLGPTMAFPEHDVLQLGVAARASTDLGTWGLVADALFASGDADYDDDRATAFKADPRYEMGLLLYRHVMTGHSGRGVATASDPDLVGMPAADIERSATRGSASNTIAVFPRAWWRPASGVEIYGGPLVAFSAASVSDPLNTRVAGGAPRNALGGDPGAYLGTELDLGVRYRRDLGDGMLTVGLEAGALRPGSALRDASGDAADSVFGGRLMIDYRM